MRGSRILSIRPFVSVGAIVCVKEEPYHLRIFIAHLQRHSQRVHTPHHPHEHQKDIYLFFNFSTLFLDFFLTFCCFFLQFSFLSVLHFCYYFLFFVFFFLQLFFNLFLFSIFFFFYFYFFRGKNMLDVSVIQRCIMSTLQWSRLETNVCWETTYRHTVSFATKVCCARTLFMCVSP